MKSIITDSKQQAGVGQLIHRITDDVKTIAKDEVELARMELEKTAKTAAADGAAIVLGGIVALIGFGMLCVTVVVALAPVISALWLRLLIMAVVYLVAGGAVAGVFVKKLRTDAPPNFALVKREAKETIHDVQEGLHA